MLVIVQDAVINGDVDEEDNGDDDDDDDSINQPGESPLLLKPQEPKQDPLWSCRMLWLRWWLL